MRSCKMLATVTFTTLRPRIRGGLEPTSSLLLLGDVRAGVVLGVVARLSSEWASGKAE